MLLLEERQANRHARATVSWTAPNNDSAVKGVAGASSETLSDELHAREAQIQEIYNSLSWRLTTPIRRLGDVYLNFRRKA
jgi:hypothetical protein